MSSSPATSTSDVSSLNRLIARLLLDELSSNSQSSETTPQSLFERNNVSEIMRNYNHTINGYNNNISVYNQNMGHIIRLIESSNSRAHSQRDTNMPYSTLRRNTAETDSYVDGSGNSVPISPATAARSYMDISGGSVPPTTPVSAPRSSNTTDISGNVSRSRFEAETFYNNRYRSLATTNIASGLFSSNRHRFRPPMTTQQTNAQTEESRMREYTQELVYSSENADLPSRCPISLTDFADGDTILQIRRCKHAFRPNDIRQWLTRNTTCPVCRRDIRVMSLPTTFPHLSDNTLAQDSSDQFINTINTRVLDEAGPTEPERANAATASDEVADDTDYSDMPPLVEDTEDTHMPTFTITYETGSFLDNTRPTTHYDSYPASVGLTTYNNEYAYVFEFPIEPIEIQDMTPDDSPARTNPLQ
jgi:hypothetical protein